MIVMGGARARVALACAVLAAVAACGADESDTAAVLDWYVVPGSVDEARLAGQCADAAGGDWSVRLHELPADVDARHTDLVRRLSADNASVDVLSLDTRLVAEMSEAGFLSPLTAAEQSALGDGVAPAPLEAASHDGRLVAAPWWFDPQLLWFRGVAAERAGLDTSEPVAWDDLLTGAQRLGVTVEIDDVGGTGTSEWVAGLLGAPGGLIGSSGPVLESAAGVDAASVVELYRDAQVGPGPSDTARESFGGAGGGFLVAPSSALSSPALQVVAPELGFTGYPVVGDEPVVPATGTALAIGRDTDARAAAVELVSCLVSPEQQEALVIATGHGAPRTAVYDQEAVQTGSVTADVVKEALLAAEPAEGSPAWNAVRRVVDARWTQLSEVSADTTPRESQRDAEAAIAGELP